ncbi:MAG: aminopeptidase P family protein [Chloroflexi bacterium]|nr:aminopeptidase P family protein [Chloroflexota bacterium]
MNFPPSEYDQRSARLQAALEQHGLDALLVTHEANFNYFTGFVVQHSWVSFTRNLIAVLPRGRSPVLVVPQSLASEARRESWIEDVAPHTSIGSAPVDVVAEVCRRLGLAQARIGAELGYEQRLNLSHVDYERLRAALPAASFADASDAIWQVRMTKSEAEIDRLRRACAITDDAFERIFAEARPGMTERQIARRVGELMMAAGADRPGWVMITSGRGEYHRTFGTPRDRAVQPGEMLWMDLAAIVDGYWSDFCRAGVFGGPTEEQQGLQEVVCQATSAGVQAIRPGIPVSAVAEAVNGELTRHGLTPHQAGRLGHGLGLLSTEPPNVTLTDQTILAPGMVITVEPVVIREDGIYQAEEDVVVRADGREVLSKAPGHLRRL